MKLIHIFFEQFHRGLRKLFVFCYRRHQWVWIITGLALGLALFQLKDLRFLVMMSDLLDPDFKTYSQFKALNHDFQEENQVSLFVKNRNGDMTFEQHCRLVRWLTKLQLEHRSLGKIFSTYGYREITETPLGFAANPVLVPHCDDAPVSAADLKLQLSKIAQSPSGPILTNQARNDIFAGFYLRNLEEGGRFGHFDKFAFEELETSYQKEIAAKEPELEANWAGIGTYQYYLQRAYEQMNVLNLITVIMAILCFRIFFGRWKTGFIFLSTYFLTMTLVYGFMAHNKYPVDSLSAAVPIMLLISTLEDFIYFLALSDKSRNSTRALQKIMLPSFYTSLTTCVGFLTLCLSDLTIIRRFGIICGVGGMIEWAVLFLLFPKALFLAKQRNWVDPIMGHIPQSIFHFSDRIAKLSFGRSWSILLLLPFLFVAWSFRGDFKISDSPEAVFPAAHPVPVATEKLMQSRGWKSEVSLVFPAPVAEKKRQSVINSIMLNAPEFISVEGFEETRDYLVGPLQRPTVRDFVTANLEHNKLTERWLSPDGPSRAVFFSNTTDVTRINAIRKFVEKICGEDCYLANILVSYSEFGLKVLATLTESFGLSLLIVGVILLSLGFHFRIRELAQLILSSFWGPVMLIFLFHTLDIGIYFATSVVMSVLVGLSGDNALQFIFSRRPNQPLEEGVNQMGASSVLTMIMMLLLSSSFLYSEFEGVRKIGLMMMGGFVLAWIGDVVVLRGLLPRPK